MCLVYVEYDNKVAHVTDEIRMRRAGMDLPKIINACSIHGTPAGYALTAKSFSKEALAEWLYGLREFISAAHIAPKGLAGNLRTICKSGREQRQ